MVLSIHLYFYLMSRKTRKELLTYLYAVNEAKVHMKWSNNLAKFCQMISKDQEQPTGATGSTGALAEVSRTTIEVGSIQNSHRNTHWFNGFKNDGDVTFNPKQHCLVKIAYEDMHYEDIQKSDE